VPASAGPCSHRPSALRPPNSREARKKKCAKMQKVEKWTAEPPNLSRESVSAAKEPTGVDGWMDGWRAKSTYRARPSC
jgi:hypothetical protein